MGKRIEMKTVTSTRATPLRRTVWLQAVRQHAARDKHLYLMLAPFLLWFILFQYKPMYGLQIAFKEYSLYRGIHASEWAGFVHFREFIGSPYFLRNLRNTVVLNVYGLLFAFPAPILLALLLNEAKNALFKKSVQTLTYLPHFISSVIVAGIVTNFLAPQNGLVNLLIEKLGGEKLYFLTMAEWFRTIYVTTFDIWKEVGFNSIIYLAALAGINGQLYEAAVIDGANRWKQTLYVTLPGLLPTIVIMLLLKIGHLMDISYENIILLYQPATYETADVISTYVYRAGMQEGRYDLATAVGVFNAIIGLTLVVTANKISRKWTQSGLW